MTQTVQSRSSACLSETGKDLSVDNLEAEDNQSLLLSVFDSLNILCEKLNKLDYILQRKKIEQILYLKNKGEKE